MARYVAVCRNSYKYDRKVWKAHLNMVMCLQVV